MQEILKDETHYKSVDSNVDNNIILEITKFYKTRNETLTKKEKNSLTKYIPKTSNFYEFPKFTSPRRLK